MRKLTRAELENKVKELEKELSATRIIASALLAGEKPCETETLPLEDVTEEWSCYRPYTAPGEQF